MAEVLAIERWLASTLGSDIVLQGLVAALGADAARFVFADYIPDGRGYPGVLFTCIGDGTVVYAQPAFEKMVKFQYRIWAVVNSADKVSLESIRDRIKALLQSKTGTNVSGQVIYAQRLSAWNPPTGVIGQQVLTRLGDVYAIWAQPA